MFQWWLLITFLVGLYVQGRAVKAVLLWVVAWVLHGRQLIQMQAKVQKARHEQELLDLARGRYSDAADSESL